jgi:uncharacterized protein YkwD
MKTYLKIIWHKLAVHHLALWLLIIGIFGCVTLQQHANQVLQAHTQAAAAYSGAHHHIPNLGNEIQMVTITFPHKNTPKYGTSDTPPDSSPVTTSAPKVAPKTTANSSSSAPSSPPAATIPPFNQSDLAPASTCPGQHSLSQVATVLTCMTAYARTQHGLVSVIKNSALVDTASAKVQDMITCGFTHTACGRPFDYWFSVKGFNGSCRAENIAQGQLTPLDVFTAWMNSVTHRTNILGPNYRYIGAAEAPSPKGITWAMELGGC